MRISSPFGFSLQRCDIAGGHASTIVQSRAYIALLLVGVFAYVVSGCGNRYRQPATTGVRVVTSAKPWSARRSSLLKEAIAMVEDGQFSSALVVLEPFRAIPDLELQELLRIAELEKLRLEAATLKANEIDRRRRVYGRLIVLDPADTNAALNYRRAIEEISKISLLSNEELCSVLREDHVDRIHLAEYERRGGHPEDVIDIKRGEIRLGMSEAASRCVWPNPRHVHVRVIPGSNYLRSAKHYIFDGGSVDITNGRVTAFSTHIRDPAAQQEPLE